MKGIKSTAGPTHLRNKSCEIIYMTKRRFGDNKKVEILGRVHQLDFKILPAPEALVYMAAELKADYLISYVDCFA